MSNLSTIGGAALWTAVVSTLMLAALTPVNVATQSGSLPSVAQGSSLVTTG